MTQLYSADCRVTAGWLAGGKNDNFTEEILVCVARSEVYSYEVKMVYCGLFMCCLTALLKKCKSEESEIMDFLKLFSDNC